MNIKICGVYCWTHIPTGRKYVGSSVDCEYRRQRHLRNARKPQPTCFSRQIATLGEGSFTFEIIETCVASERLAREKHHIERLRALVPNGFNIHKDPTLGPSYCWSEDMRVARSVLGKKRFSTPESRADHAEKIKLGWSDSARQAQRIRIKTYWATPDGLAKAATHSARMKVLRSKQHTRQLVLAYALLRNGERR